MLSYSIDRLYVETNFILPSVDVMKISLLSGDMDCSYVNVQLDSRVHTLNHCSDIVICKHGHTHIHTYMIST